MKSIRIFLSLAFLFVLFSNFVPPIEQNRLSEKFRLAYTTAEDSNAITPIDLRTGDAGEPIQLEHHPRSIVISPDASIAYILQQGSNEIIPVDLRTGKACHPIVLERNPLSMVITPEGNKSYVIYEGSNQVNAIELETGSSEVITSLEEMPFQMALAPEGKILYVSYEESTDITPIELASGNLQANISLRGVPKAIAVTQDGRLAYVEDSSPQKMLFHNLETGELTESLIIANETDDTDVMVEKKIQHINISPDGKTAYLTEENSQEIITVNLKTQLVDGTINLEHPIKSLAISPILTRNTATVLMSSAASAVFGESITFTAAVTSLVDTDTGTPTGTVTFVDAVLGEIGTGTLDANGNVIFTTSSLPVGSYSLSANYGGDSDYNPSSSALPQFIQEINQASTTTVIDSSTNPSCFGNSATFTATVAMLSPGMGTPTGSVEFYNGATRLGSGILSATAPYQATFTTESLMPGTYSISAVYGGDTNFVESTSSSLAQTVSRGTTTTRLGTTQTHSPFGDTVTFTATIAGNIGTEISAGTVTFKDGLTILGTQPILAGESTLSTNALTVGTHTVVAVYSGNDDFSGSESPELSQVITQRAATTAIISSVNPSIFGQEATFTATVSVTTGAEMPTGTITFQPGEIIVALDGNGEAVLTVSSLTAGSHAITATYSGDTNFSGSTTALNQTVDKAPTIVSVASETNPSDFGTAVSITGTVTPLNNVSTVLPTNGAVTAYYAGTAVGSGTLNASGQYVISLSDLPAGTLSIEVEYSGDANFDPSTITFTQTVNQAVSTTTISSSSNPSVIGESVAFSVNVTSSAGSSIIPTGNISFFDDALLISTESLDASGSATLIISNLSNESHSIKAVYSGDETNHGSVASLTQAVNLNETTMSLSSALNPAVYGESVTLRSSVNRNGVSSETPTGTITFQPGETIVTLDSNGEAVFTVSSLTAGSHSITATYSGDTTFSGSSATLNQTVDKAPTIVSVASETNPSDFGTAVSITGTVTPLNNVSTVLPTDAIVTAYYAGTAVGSGTLNASGQYVISLSDLPAGTLSIEVEYSGDANFDPSTITFTQTVNQAVSTTTISSSSNPSVIGESVAFSVNVTSSAGSSVIPTGNISFFDGSSLISTESLDAFGSATLITSILSNESHSITAIYSGDTTFSGSTATLNQTVNLNETTMSLSSALNPAVYGESVTLRTSVNRNGVSSETPTGTITFQPGETIVTLDSNGEAMFTVSSLTAGSHAITAIYSGDTTFNGSTATLNQTVDKAPTIVSVASETNPSDFGTAVSITGTVTPLNNVSTVLPTDAIVTAYYAGTAVGSGTLNASGQYVISLSDLPAGTLSIDVEYSGDANFDPSTISFIQTVNEELHTTIIVEDVTNPVVSPIEIMTTDEGLNDIVDQVVNLKSTSTVIWTSSPNPSNVGESVSFIVSASAIHEVPTGLVTFYDGITPLGTTSLIEGIAMFSTASLTAGVHSITVAYEGHENYSPSVSLPYTQQVNSQQVVNEPAIILESPLECSGRQVVYKGSQKTDRVNVLKWKAPAAGTAPQYYEIYRNAGLTDRIAVIPSNSSLKYKHHHRRKGKTYTYYLVAVNQNSVSPPVSVTVKPRKKKSGSNENLMRHIDHSYLDKNFPNVERRSPFPKVKE